MIHLLLALFVLSHRTYTVQTGDTLYGISARYLGNGDDWPGLYAANRQVVGADPNLIFPGERLELTTWTPVATETDTQPVQPPAPVGGTLSCGGLERLWKSAGGAPGSAFIAAEIAMAESGGNQYATGPAGERGYWQINTDHGSLSTYDAYGNARAAVAISNDGTDWYPWTTFTSGAYAGRC